MSAALPNGGTRFGAFELDPQSGELRKHGLRVKLQDQPFRILVTLLEKPGEVVSREELRERIWGKDTLVDFEHGLSAAVNRLREALGDSADNPRYVETMARRGYRFIAPVEVDGARLGRPAQARVRAAWLAWIAVAGGLAALAVGVWLSRSGGEAPAPPLQPVPLTSYEGVEIDPSFSPDGTQVAFNWNPAPGATEGSVPGDNFDIYVKTVGFDPPLRLTTDPAPEGHPAWSPDGRYIAFRRRQGIYVVPPTGGPQRQLVPEPLLHSPVSWSADGGYLAFARPSAGDEAAGIFAIPIEGGTARRITTAQPPGTHSAPSFSPDGKLLAFASCPGATACDLSVVTLDAANNPRGLTRIISQRSNIIFEITWTEDGHALVFSERFQDYRCHLWRVPVDGNNEPELLSFAGLVAEGHAISRTGRRLAYSAGSRIMDIWRLDNAGAVRNAMSSTFRDTGPQFSPDGRRVALVSNRSGRSEVWVNADGSGAMQLTRSRSSGSPRWSRDG